MLLVLVFPGIGIPRWGALVFEPITYVQGICVWLEDGVPMDSQDWSYSPFFADWRSTPLCWDLLYCNRSVPPQSNPLLKSHLLVGSRSVICFNYLVVYGRILKTCGPYPISRTRQQLIFLLVKHPISVDQLHLAG